MTKTKDRKLLSPNKQERLYEGAKIWTNYYRQNIHRFAKDYLGLNLKPFQDVMMYSVHSNDQSVIIASRGLGKSWILAVYMCCVAILYPGILITISCETREQSRRLVSSKILNDLYHNCPNLRREISERNIKVGSNESFAKFHNGSVITALNASPNTRGQRSHLLLVDEYVMIRGEMETLKTVLEPFLQVPRQPPYTKNPQYADIVEETKKVYLSSAYYADHWAYGLYKDYVEKMLIGESSFACNLPYQVSRKYGLMTETRLQQILDDPTMTEEGFQMEYGAQWWKQNDGAYIKPTDIIPNRTVVKAWYPPTLIEYIEEKDKRHKSWQEERTSKQELRILGCDVAFASSSNGKNNDNTIIHYGVAIPKNEKYMAEIKYSECINGQNAKSIALRLKQLYYDGDCDYIVLDVLGSGLAVLDILSEYTYDEERNIKYPPMKCFNLKDKEERCGYREAIPCIYGVVANEQINNEIAVTLKSSFQNHTLRLLVNEFEAEDFLSDHYDFQLKSNEEKVRLMYPYLQTTLIQTEIIKLRTEITRHGLKLIEFGQNTKDRFSALAYMNKFIREQENKLKKPKSKGNFLSLW